MDNVKQTAGETFSSGSENLPEISFHIGTDDGYVVSVASELSENDGQILEVAAELVRRWNAYPELIEALRGIVNEIEEYGFIGVDGVDAEHENHWSGSPSMQVARTILSNNSNQ